MKILLITISFISLLLLPAAESQAVSIGFTPTPLPVVEGRTFNIDLAVSGLGGSIAPSLSSFDLNVHYHGGILAFDHVVYGDPRLGDQLDSGLGVITTTTVGFDTVNLFELSLEDWPMFLDVIQPDSFVLATLYFKALGCGTTNLVISEMTLGDAWGNLIDAESMTGVVDVHSQPVPEPATCLLLATCLAGFAATRLRSRNV